MTRPERRDFQPEDLLQIEVGQEVGGQRNGYDILAWGKAHKAMGPSVTLAVDGKPAACGGFGLLWMGTAEMWATIEKNCRPGVVIAIRTQVDEWIRDYALDRVQSMTPASWRPGQRFLEWLGFEPEGVLRKMGPHGIDQILYARVR